MANWIILTGADIRLLTSEQTAMTNVVPLQTIDESVVSAANKVRSYVAGGGNPLEPSPAVPPECVDDVLALARYSYLAQEPSGSLLTDIRQKERDDADAHLRDIAKGIASITQADILATDEQFGRWGSATRIAMRTEAVPPTGTQIQTASGIWKYSSQSAMTDPGAGVFRTNTASPATVTQIAIARMTNDTQDRQSVLRSLGPGDPIDFQGESTPANSMHFTINATPTDNGTWFLIPVTYVSSGGANPTNNDITNITFTY